MNKHLKEILYILLGWIVSSILYFFMNIKFHFNENTSILFSLGGGIALGIAVMVIYWFIKDLITAKKKFKFLTLFILYAIFRLAIIIYRNKL